MDISREELLDIVKRNGLSEEQAEQFLEMVAKGLGGSIVDIAKLVVSKLENQTVALVAGMIVSSLEPTAREAIKKIEVNL